MIEEKIQKLIEAIEANTEAVKFLTKQQGDFTPSQPQFNVTTTTQPMQLVEPATMTLIPDAANETLKKIEKLKAVSKPVEPAPAPSEAVAPKTPAITLESLTELALKVVSLGAEAAKRIKALNEQHGIERITKCPPEKFAAVHDSLIALRKELGGVE